MSVRSTPTPPCTVVIHIPGGLQDITTPRLPLSYAVTGTISDHQTVALDERLPLEDVKVRVVTEPIDGPRGSYAEVMAGIRDRQQRRGYQPASRVEVDQRSARPVRLLEDEGIGPAPNNGRWGSFEIIAVRLARHSVIRLTLAIRAHVALSDQAAAFQSLKGPGKLFTR